MNKNSEKINENNLTNNNQEKNLFFQFLEELLDVSVTIASDLNGIVKKHELDKKNEEIINKFKSKTSDTLHFLGSLVGENKSKKPNQTITKKNEKK